MLKYLLTGLFGGILALGGVAKAGVTDKVSEQPPDHSIEVTVDIPSRTITGTDRIRVKKDASRVRLLLRDGSDVEGVLAGGQKADFTVGKAVGGAKRITVELPVGQSEITVRFKGTFQSIESAREKIKRGVAYVDDGVIGPEGVFMPSSSLWYPREYGTLHTATATVTVADGFRTVMEGELSRSEAAGGYRTETWNEARPVDGMDLVAGRYVVDEEDYKGVRIYTYFFDKEPALSRTYIDKTKGYLDRYSKMIAPYPFKKFAVVEDFLPTGYGMPSFTLLGSAVLRLPFIPDTSLGHEIAHNWWGNSVFMDDRQGNWIEALTTYVADYRFERDNGAKEAREYRLDKLRRFKNYAGARSIPLTAFTDATTPADRAVGYSKGMMVFNMLEGEIGTDAFGRGLKKLYEDNAFRRASWTDVRTAFEAASGRDLKWFFNEWLLRSGGPELELRNVEIKKTGDTATASFDVEQATAEPYRLDMQVVFNTPGGTIERKVKIDKKTQRYSFELKEAPSGFTLDPDYEVFRALKDAEMPPSLASCFGAKGTVIVVPDEKRSGDKYSAAAELYSKDFGLEVASDSEAGARDFVRESSLFVFGWPGENRVSRLAGQYLSTRMKVDEKTFTVDGKTFDRAGTVAAVAVKNAAAPGKTICFVMSGAPKTETIKAARRLRYFSEYGYVVLPADKSVVHGRFEVKNLLSYTAGDKHP